MYSLSPATVQQGPARVATLTGWVLVCVSLIGFAGWAFHLPLLASTVPGAIPMKANTAAAFLLAALALLRRDHRDRTFYSICVIAIGALTEIESLANSD